MNYYYDFMASGRTAPPSLHQRPDLSPDESRTVRDQDIHSYTQIILGAAQHLPKSLKEALEHVGTGASYVLRHWDEGADKGRLDLAKDVQIVAAVLENIPVMDVSKDAGEALQGGGRALMGLGHDLALARGERVLWDSEKAKLMSMLEKLGTALEEFGKAVSASSTSRDGASSATYYAKQFEEDALKGVARKPE